MKATPPPVPYEDLATSDLTVGGVYRGGPQPHVGADPLHYLMGVGNSGGFRTKTAKSRKTTALCVLFSTGAISLWPDGWGSHGNYIYYGDQREPVRDVLDTPRKGNVLLAEVAERMTRGAVGRALIPPFFLFEKDGPGRDVRFEGVLVPAGEKRWLKVVTRPDANGLDVTNFQATFERLSITRVPRAWIASLQAGTVDTTAEPQAWADWVRTGNT